MEVQNNGELGGGAVSVDGGVEGGDAVFGFGRGGDFGVEDFQEAAVKGHVGAHCSAEEKGSELHE